jgi:predicted AAA+ superfamily ATPase
MVFVGGPRQVGKTTLAKQLLNGRPGYLNWDVALDRSQILARSMPASDLWVFDELHKFRGWRNYLKGLYDARPSGQQILVTGSARLDWYRFGGDSLQGRYHYLRLHSFSLKEVSGASLEALMRFGGFPRTFPQGVRTKRSPVVA